MKQGLKYFKTEDFHTALRTFFKDLNIPVNYIAEEPARPQDILSYTYKKDHPAFQLMEDAYFLGMVDDAAFEGNASLAPEKIESDYDGILIFGVTLNSRDNGLLPTRSQLAEITRSFNREFHYTPVVVVFKYGNHIAFANAERLKYKQEWREGEKAGKVSLLRDVDLDNLHSGHQRILSELAISRSGKNAVKSFADLYIYWQTVFNVSLLNKKFYEELSNWYFWALKNVIFPGASLKSDQNSLLQEKERVKEHNAQNLIRLLTRILFVWFVKEKNLIPEELFDEGYIKNVLLNKFIPKKQKMVALESQGDMYYRAILQNLFFATLNQIKGKREFRKDNQHMNVTNLMRYESYFKDSDKFVKLVEERVPFMNGGLFECLDSPDPELKGRRGGDVIVYQDGFSDRNDNKLMVPDYIFWSEQEIVDLSEDFGKKTKAYKEAKAKGLINILRSYKFTITENTPIEEDIALDPELLGKVFENLLASYNPETKTTARKQTGSFYTPREIVNYMVDESLIAYLKNAVKEWGMMEDKVDVKLHQLLSFDAINPFVDNKLLQTKIITALDRCAILDPACGSGAFPMGILQKMVHILRKVDPNNTHWQELQMKKALKETESAFRLEDKEARKQKLIEINEAFDSQINDPDYARKLFLVENCIYGVDIQPIAAQISKLRFFISLVVDQKVDRDKENFGIRPLPNLETKFIAANTLIGIEKPENHSHLVENQGIKELTEELKGVRHRLFSAKTPSTKRKLRNEDRTLREKMGELLVASGWANKNAKQLAAWDPYDQNASFPFFDPEWMFGVKDGFDVVIGNPPYGATLSDDEKELLKNRYSHLVERIRNSFLYFIGLSDAISNQKGTISFIIPNEFLFQIYMSKARAFFLRERRMLNVVNIGESAFEAIVSTCIIIFGKEKSEKDYEFKGFDFRHNNLVEAMSKINSGEAAALNSAIILNATKSIYSFDAKLAKIAEKIEARGVPLSELCDDVANGISTSCDSVYVINHEDEAYFALSRENLLRPTLKGGDFQKYRCPENSGKSILYVDKSVNLPKAPESYKYLHSYKELLISKSVEKKQGKRKWHLLFRARKPTLFACPKIIARQTGDSVITAVDDKVGYFCIDSVNIISLKRDMRVHCFSISAILNSSVSNFYYQQISQEAGRVLAQVKPSRLKAIPIVIPDDNSLFEDLYKIINILELSDQKAKCYEQVVDGLVFELYFPDHMKEKQIDILQFVERDLAEVVRGRNFEQLPSSEKERIINQLHVKWTHPDSEVRNRIKLFAVRSPDILKPILESR
jgi:hypothetical protein